MQVRSLIGPTKGNDIKLPYTAAQNAVASGFAARAEGVTYPNDFPGAPQVMSTTGKLATDVAAEDVSGTVAQAQERVAAVADIEALDALEAAEKAAKNRKGVLEAVAKRRGELDPTFGTVVEVTDRIATLDAAQLDAAEKLETDGKGRKGVLSAIEARRAALATPPPAEE